MAVLGNPKNTIEILQKYNFNFQKKFGQNFLINTGVLEDIIDAAEVTDEDMVLEIGPGIGTMTQYLCENAGQVIAVEIDTNLIPILKDTLSAYDNVRIINDDILNKYPNLIVIKSISKSYGVPGLRLGVLASGNYEYLDIINRNMPVWNINSFAEYFLQIFLIYKKDYVNGCSKIKEERNRFYNELIKISELDVYDSEANYFMIKLNKSTANEIAEYLLDNNKILIKVLNGKNGFDDKEYIRIAVKTKEENDYFIQSIKEYYDKK